MKEKIENLVGGSFGRVGKVAGLLGVILGANAVLADPPVTVRSHLPNQTLIADGATIYEMRVRVDSSVGIGSTNWRVRFPNDRFILEDIPFEPQIPQENDYFEGVPMDPSWNFVATTVDGSNYLQPNTRNTTGQLIDGEGDLEVIYFRVRQDAPLGGVVASSCPSTCNVSNPVVNANFDINAIDFSDGFQQYKTTNGGVIVQRDPYTIVAPQIAGDIDGNGVVDAGDVGHFVGVLLGTQTDPDYLTRADLNEDALNNAADIQPFVEAYLQNAQ